MAHLTVDADDEVEESLNWSELAVPLRENSTVKVLELLNFDSSIGVFCNVLTENRWITSLIIRDCVVDVTDSRILAEGLKANNSLKSLDVSRCSFQPSSDDAIKVIIEGLKLNRGVQEFVFCRNNLQCVGAVHVADLLRTNRVIKSLNIMGITYGKKVLQSFLKL